MPMTHELIVDSVVVRFGERTVVSGGYVTARTGSVTGLLGRNGTGKSCMFRALMGGLKVDYVQVHIDSDPIDLNRIGLKIKYLPQGRMIPDGLTLKQAFQLYQVDFWNFVLLFPKYSGKYHARLWEMSGGEDIEAVQRLIREKCREKGIIVTDHNYEAISTVADRLFVLSDGYTHPVESRDDLVRHGYLLPQ